MSRRAIALTAAIIYVLSWVFPVVAGLMKNPTSLPQWWGTADVALAFVVGVGALVIPGLGRGDLDKQAERTTYRIYRISLHALLVVGVLVMLAGDRIKWTNCATGFLWRTWLFLYILPWWLAAAGRPEFADPLRNSSKKLILSSRVVGHPEAIGEWPGDRIISGWPVIRPELPNTIVSDLFRKDSFGLESRKASWYLRGVRSRRQQVRAKGQAHCQSEG